jgi:hypothetical protein
LQHAVIIAVVAVCVMKAPINQVIDVIAVRHRFVAAVQPMNMCLLMSGAVVVWCTPDRIHRGDLDSVVVHMAVVRVVQVPIVKVVDVAVVLHGGVSTIRAMLVKVFPGMFGMRIRHVYSFMSGLIASQTNPMFVYSGLIGFPDRRIH